jgi:hypothetical protein
MSAKIEKKTAGRPPVPTASLKTKPNITISNQLQQEAQEAAAALGIGYSEWVARAMQRQIAIDQEFLARKLSVKRFTDDDEADQLKSKS